MYALLALTIILFGLIQLYFRIADRYNIIDRPNERSSHTKITIRGGGVVFVFAGLAYALYTGFSTPWFWVGFLLMGGLGFADDVLTLPSGRRLLAQLAATSMMLYEVFGVEQPWWIWLVALIIATGISNAYNFMDGINGITVLYSVVVLSALAVANHYVSFTDPMLIYAFLVACVVFGYYNVRTTARCFAGDVGSVSIAFLIVYLLLELVVATGNIAWSLLILVYGVDTILTLIRRIRKGENIFEAHRQHLYQWMTRPGPYSHIQVSLIYAGFQIIAAALLLYAYSIDRFFYPTVISLILLYGFGYLYIRRRYVMTYKELD